MTEEIVKVPFGTVSHIDLDSIDDVSDDGLETFFGKLGESATASQLRIFLDGSMEDDGEDSEKEKAELVARFVERRVETVRSLRAFKASFSSILRE